MTVLPPWASWVTMKVTPSVASHLSQKYLIVVTNINLPYLKHWKTAQFSQMNNFFRTLVHLGVRQEEQERLIQIPMIFCMCVCVCVYVTLLTIKCQLRWDEICPTVISHTLQCNPSWCYISHLIIKISQSERVTLCSENYFCMMLYFTPSSIIYMMHFYL